MCAVYPDARNPFAHPELLAEGLEPHTVPEIWLMAAPHAEPRRRHHRHLRPQDRRPAPAPEPGGRGRVARGAHPHLGRGRRPPGRAGRGPSGRVVPGRRHPLTSRCRPSAEGTQPLARSRARARASLGRGPARTARGPRAPGGGPRRAPALDTHVVRLDRGDPLPAPGRCSAARSSWEAPWGCTTPTRSRGSRPSASGSPPSVTSGVAVLGVCLGAQQLAAAARGVGDDRPVSEIGVGEVELTAEGRADPVLGSRRRAGRGHPLARRHLRDPRRRRAPGDGRPLPEPGLPLRASRLRPAVPPRGRRRYGRGVGSPSCRPA